MEQFVLIAEDDQALSKLIQTVVENEGFYVASAADGKEAYKTLKSGIDFAAAIVDLNMPYIDGNDLVKFMRKDDKLAAIPVLMITGERDPAMWEKAMASGAVAFLLKPFTNFQLRAALQTLVRGRRS